MLESLTLVAKAVIWPSSSVGLEYLTTNQRVGGSSPSWVTNKGSKRRYSDAHERGAVFFVSRIRCTKEPPHLPDLAARRFFVQRSVDMVFFPGNLAEADVFQKIDDILSPVIVRTPRSVLRHQNDRHVGEKSGHFLPERSEPGGILRDVRLHADDGEGDALFDNDSTVNDHGKAPLQMVCSFIVAYSST